MKTSRNFLLIPTICCILLASASNVLAQKIGYIDSQYILNNIPEYAEAKKSLNEISKSWEKEVESLMKDLEKLEKAYEAEKILMTDDMRKQKKKEVKEKEVEVEELRREKFGINGELYKKRQELIKPIQDKIFATIKEISRSGNYAIFFDKSSKPTNILYVDPKYNKSDQVLKKMGYKPGS